MVIGVRCISEEGLKYIGAAGGNVESVHCTYMAIGLECISFNQRRNCQGIEKDPGCSRNVEAVHGDKNGMSIFRECVANWRHDHCK